VFYRLPHSAIPSCPVICSQSRRGFRCSLPHRLPFSVHQVVARVRCVVDCWPSPVCCNPWSSPNYHCAFHASCPRWAGDGRAQRMSRRKQSNPKPLKRESWHFVLSIPRLFLAVLLVTRAGLRLHREAACALARVFPLILTESWATLPPHICCCKFEFVDYARRDEVNFALTAGLTEVNRRSVQIVYLLVLNVGQRIVIRKSTYMIPAFYKRIEFNMSCVWRNISYTRKFWAYRATVPWVFKTAPLWEYRIQCDVNHRELTRYEIFVYEIKWNNCKCRL